MSVLSRKTLIAAAGVLVLALAYAGWSTRQSEATAITVYKDPNCGCCSKWVDHLTSDGFTVTTKDVADLGSIKRRHGIPAGLGSCHTALVGDYVVEGHVPADVIQRLLDEKPNIRGIAVPGMPIGSPGMEGPNPQPYAILSFDQQGNTAVYDRR